VIQFKDKLPRTPTTLGRRVYRSDF